MSYSFELRGRLEYLRENSIKDLIDLLCYGCVKNIEDDSLYIGSSKAAQVRYDSSMAKDAQEYGKRKIRENRYYHQACYESEILNINEIYITLIKSKEDMLGSQNCQADLKDFYNYFPEKSLIQARYFAMDSMGGVANLIGEFILKLTPATIPLLSLAAHFWLTLRTGRKLHLKVGDIEVEANNLEDFDALLSRIPIIQKSTLKS